MYHVDHVLFASFLVLVFTNIAIFSDPRYLRWIGYYALLAIVIDLVFMYTYFAYAHNTIWEWLAVFSALLWVAMVSYNLLVIDRRTKIPNTISADA